ncbi:PleD family two-component system response regulator [Streptomyces sp. NPDC127069]|uniref:response regulator n=1 Tax=Streptomyces sp. NPDC127069 TaxID=3347128 RepID=UPI0036642A6A
MPPAQSSAADTRVKILLVDEQPENLLTLESNLAPLDQTLVRASSGEEALKALNNGTFALILLATRMSEMDGYETAAHIKRRARTRDIPIIFVSPHEMSADANFRVYAAGAVDHVWRPYDPWVLRAKAAVFVELHQKNAQLRAQATLLRTRAATGLLAQLSTLLSDVEMQARDLTGQLQAQEASATTRTAAAHLEREVRSLRRVLRDASELEGEPDALPTPASLHPSRHRDR